MPPGADGAPVGDAEGASGSKRPAAEQIEEDAAAAQESKRRKMLVNAKAAGLPARPTFDAPDPEPRAAAS